MKKHEFFGIPLFQKKVKNHAKIKEEILGSTGHAKGYEDPMESQWLKKENKQGLAFSDYKAGAELSGAYNHLGAIKYMEDSKGNYDASQLGLETFYSDYFAGVVDCDHKALDKLYAPEIEAFMKGVQEILESTEEVCKENYVVHFVEFGPSSLDILVQYHLQVDGWSHELQVRTAINLEVIRLTERLGVDFAFPSQSLYVETLPDKS